jgi:hypothetical protein
MSFIHQSGGCRGLEGGQAWRVRSWLPDLSRPQCPGLHRETSKFDMSAVSWEAENPGFPNLRQKLLRLSRWAQPEIPPLTQGWPPSRQNKTVLISRLFRSWR